ncbi:hypothetical protein CAPTEDRAFT_207681 [Capitella teleta]|uniref:G-protein coupled receptors family 1 profile domain-containing protein n=1 Tax=Capitella teleta TaxID=283909 RepID=R7V0Z2_CAPTE|nr:hypothetical protein CAPTEDRAFT_207681 [Capitella teleta]|eukprot:ELU09892.1 hypothetical protein CAPTEDRAFT_207681 [Capitella teleta]
MICKPRFLLLPLLVFALRGRISSTQESTSPTSVAHNLTHKAHDTITVANDDNIDVNEIKFQFWEYRAGLLFQAYGGIVVVILGFFGNILTLAVLTTSYSMNSSTIFLIQLAASDLGVICVGQLSRNFPRSWTGYDTASQHPWMCKLWFFINHSFKTISGWTLAAVTIERVIVVYMPLKAKRYCTKDRAKLAIVIIDILCMGSYLHYFWTYGSTYDSFGNLEAGCTIMKHIPELSFYITQVRPWQDLFMRTGGPFFVLLVCNCLIVAKLIQHAKNRKKMTGGSDIDESQTKSMTRMLLTVSFAFLCLISPMQIMYLVDRSDPYGWVITERWQAIASMRWGVTAPLYYLNHAINFLLYCLSGREFRRAFSLMFRKMCVKCGNTAMEKSSIQSSVATVSENLDKV